MDQDEPPILTAVSSSARQLFLLLRCVAFSTKAHIQLSELGINVCLDETTSMSAAAFLDKSLFTTYTYHAPPTPQNAIQDSDDSSNEDDEPPQATPIFQISLPALLETLQIFGLTDPASSRPPWARDNPYPTSTAFSNNVLGMNNLCRISYTTVGAPLSVTLTEASIRTQCDLTTYEADTWEDLPFDTTALACKIIMPASHLFDAISELSATTPEKLTLHARTVKGKHYLALSAEGTLGSARVEFNNQPRPPTKSKKPAFTKDGVPAGAPPPTALFETFQLSDADTTLKGSFKFSLVQKAARAMSVAKKVSMRIDLQGVLSLNFMVAVDGGGGLAAVDGGGNAAEEKVSFVHFKFVPLVEEEGDDAGDGEGADETMLGGESGVEDEDPF
ncbi:hypothetical protein NX059_009392 [Plenodomus lindquistii]|nr:hypothetical protein NX059_009392 [Plenodomus lindquistii]